MGDYTEKEDIIDREADQGLWALQLKGVQGYPAFLEALKSKISPSEAKLAKAKFEQAKRWLWLAVLAPFFSVVIYFNLADVLKGPLVGLAIIIPIILAQILAFKFDILFAGRLLMVLAGLNPALFHTVVVDTDLAFSVRGIIFFMTLLFCYVAGFAVDYNAAARFKQKVHLLYSLAIALVGGFSAAIVFFISTLDLSQASDLADIGDIISEQNTVWFLVLIFVVGQVLLSVVLDKFIRNSWHDNGDDPLIVYRAGLQRWRASMVGKTAAFVTTFYIFMVLLNSLSLVESLENIEESDDHLSIERNSDAGPAVYFWRREMTILKVDHFQDPNIHFFSLPSSADDFRKAITARPSLQMLFNDWKEAEGILTEESYAEFTYLFSQFEITDLDALKRQITIEERPGNTKLWIIEEVVRESDGLPASIFVFEPFDEATQRTSYGSLSSVQQAILFRLVAALVAAMLAFIFLWERGGDSDVAKGIGYWLIAAAIASIAPTIGTNSSSLLYNYLLAVDQNLMQEMFPSYFVLISMFPLSIWGFVALGCFGWMTYFKVRQFHATASDHTYNRAIFWLKVISCYILSMLCLNGLLYLINGEDYTVQLWMLLAFSSLLVSLLLGKMYLARKRADKGSFQRDQRRLYVSGIVAGAGLIHLYSLILYRHIDLSPYGFLVGIILMTLSGVAYLLTNSEYRNSAARDLSYIVTSFLLPVVFINIKSILFSVVQFVGISSDLGVDILSFFFGMLIVRPLLKTLEKFFNKLINPRMNAVMQRANDILETSIVAKSFQELASSADELLKEMKVEEYVLLSRVEDNTFEVVTNRLDKKISNFAISGSLCKFLAKRRDPIDLSHLHMDWDIFFQQFELARIGDYLGGGHLVPIRLGRSLRGLLYVAPPSDGDNAKNIKYVDAVNDLGVLSTALK